MSKVRYRVLLDFDADPSGDRLCLLLQGVDRLGSINRAAADLKVSYRHAWGLIKKAEEQLGFALLHKRVGGVQGGGAELTAQARDLLTRYEQVRAEVGARLGDPCSAEQPPAAADQPAAGRPVLLASTIGPIETGLVAALEDEFYSHAGILVRHIAAGTGQALQIAREGRVDLVLTHARQMEEEFVAGGFGLARHPLMSNDFLLVGPASDPAAAHGAGSARAAFQRIAAAQAPFVSRGDRSGTHTKELELWQAAGVLPAGPWYRVYQLGATGSAATLCFAAEVGAYTLVDRATYVVACSTGLQLALLLEGDPRLHNEFSLIPVNPQRFPRANHQAAVQFIAWATGPEGRRVIAAFGRNRYGEPLFLPAAAAGA